MLLLSGLGAAYLESTVVTLLLEREGDGDGGALNSLEGRPNRDTFKP